MAGTVQPHTNDCIKKRRLRIGYVSPDFRAHSVAYFIEPVLKYHDSGHYEIFCYYNHTVEDSVTRRLRAHTDHWRTISGLSDDEAAQLIRKDHIDILVDLAGHTGNNRLLVFARKPAPIQATWLGYLNTTGLAAMDYRITDHSASPPGITDRYHSENLIRLPDSQWCYQPPAECPPVTPLPALTTGLITFGSLHNLAKVTPEVIRLWSRVLMVIPDSRLIMAARGLNRLRLQMEERFAEDRIKSSRLELLDAMPFDEYLALHQRIDVNLDTFPYSGGTTTCHSLWMGVPIITLAGETVTSRGGASLLGSLRLTELIAKSETEYLDIAVHLGKKIEFLAAIRTGLRERMINSPLTNAQNFTKNLEQAYRDMWERWCTREAG